MEWDFYSIIKRMIKLILGLIIFFHGVLLTKLLFFPYPELFIYPYLTNNGLAPYKEILDQHFPGLMFLPINFDNLGMRDPEIARIWLITLIIVIHLLLFFIAKNLLKSEKKALLVNLLFLLWEPFFEGWVLWIDNFLPLFLLPSAFFLIRKKYLFSGILLGIAILFKQTIIPLSGIILLFIFWESKKIKEAAKFGLAAIMPIGLASLYFLKQGLFYDFFYWTIIFNLTVYAGFGTTIPQTVGFVTRILFVYLGSLLALFSSNKRVVLILFLYLIGSLAGVFDRADFVHFQPSLPFALLLTTIGVYSLKVNNPFKLGVLFYILVTLWWQHIFYKGHISEKILLFDDSVMQTASKIKEYTHPGERIFVFGGAPHLYSLSQTLPAGNIFVYQFPWFLKVAQGRILEGIIKDKPKIIVYDETFTVNDQSIREFSKSIDQYITANYESIDQVGTTQILRLKSK